MASKMTFQCDWCGTDVPAKAVTPELPDSGKFAAQVLVTTPSTFGQDDQRVYDVCGSCKSALDALTQGKFRRGA